MDNLQAYALSSSGIAVSWSPPQSPNGMISVYDLTVTDDNNSMIDLFEFFVYKVKSAFYAITKYGAIEISKSTVL